MTLITDSRTQPRKSLLLVSSEYEAVLTPVWFCPDFWAGDAQPVSTGGRGSAWFISEEKGSLVLRHYRRGGLMARLAEKTYLFTGFDQARSISEFRLLESLLSAGLPVPEPVAAIAWKTRVFWYQAAILIKRIPDAVTFADSLMLGEEQLWRKLGRVIREFHDFGLDHVDLNCDNILVTRDQIYLIDFDRCRLRSSSVSGGEPWKSRNLLRLRRSMRKRICFSEPMLEQFWEVLVDAYQSGS
ncbi:MULTISPECIES: 3-deoxy-D-manno-octulosonic acid kinase [unclassified Marinobacter]|uniref:3-deoxy-D-manno-octulosonic acid kinase n=1 Tax=unclassified Marinobacter TaxID=83889 RepID=UPI0026E37A32|nr:MULTISPECIES: 3-deoxy-D-manno-octulosonic acid kinase [unclassified Marinobacter]MDO6443874.1 3-deoxy-D-manno-octulosonic acid kinase [Marinobacter sp. 2_MG-2023]MDO6825237.1 3-deoxy-D-manno-octulosonic acid kinase [Marinobacter sp. 1_MG-2023]